MFPAVPRLARRSAQLALGLLAAAGALLLFGAIGASPASASQCPPAYAPPFNDVPLDSPFCTEIHLAKTHGAIGGDANGNFNPTAPVRRAEVTAILINTLFAEQGMPVPPCPIGPFVDVPRYHAFCSTIRMAVVGNFVNGFADGTFRPADPITRGAVAAVLTRYPEGPLPLPACIGAVYPDVQANHVFCQAIQIMSAINVVNGYPDGTFRPESDVTRQEFVAMFVRWVEYMDN